MKSTLLQRLQQNTLGILASLSFFFGSMLFLPTFASYATLGVWLFMTGSALMFIDIIRDSSHTSQQADELWKKIQALENNNK